MPNEAADTALAYVRVNLGAVVGLMLGAWLLSALVFRVLVFVDRRLSPAARPEKTSAELV